MLGALALLVAWAFGAVALHAAGQNARGLREEVQRSAILGALNDALPPSGPFLHVLRRVDPSPSVRGPDPNVAAPNGESARDPQVRAAAQSGVRVLGTACGLGRPGLGLGGRARQLVVTNAHVVAGEDDTTVTLESGAELDATVVHYDPHNDLAILAVPGLDLTPLDLVEQPRRGTDGAVIGYPENGPLTVVPARIGTHGTRHEHRTHTGAARCSGG